MKDMLIVMEGPMRYHFCSDTCCVRPVGERARCKHTCMAYLVDLQAAKVEHNQWRKAAEEHGHRESSNQQRHSLGHEKMDRGTDGACNEVFRVAPWRSALGLLAVAGRPGRAGSS